MASGPLPFLQSQRKQLKKSLILNDMRNIPKSLATILAAKRVLITGTDTDIGKTRVSCALLDAAHAAGYRAMGLKPIASGSELDPQTGVLHNEDTLLLRQHSFDPNAPYTAHNWISLTPAIAPHIAAREAAADSAAFDLVGLRAWLKIPRTEDFTLIEGAGGFCSPLLPMTISSDWSHNFDHSELANAADAATIMIVGLRLGCIHQARSTLLAIRSQTNYLGWIANILDPAMPRLQENLQTLAGYCGEPLATLEHGANQLRFDRAPLEFVSTPIKNQT
jgi:dethiobiotin synthetase